MKRVFILGLTFIVILSASLGLFLFISLWPYFTIIGKFAAGVVIVGLLCIATLLVSFTYNRIGIWSARRRREHLLSRVISVGDIVVLPMVDGSVMHLSAEHERAKVPLPQMALPSPTRPEPVVEQDIVLELYNSGVSLRNIVETTGLTYYQVQKITSESKKK